MVGWAPVRASSASSVNDSSTSDSPSSVSSESSVCPSPPIGVLLSDQGRPLTSTAGRTLVTRHPDPLEHVPLLPGGGRPQVSQLAHGPALELGQDPGAPCRIELVPADCSHHLPCGKDLSHRGTFSPRRDRTRLHSTGSPIAQPLNKAVGRVPRVPGRQTLLPQQ